MVTRIWNSGVGDWYDPTMWQTATPDPNSYPLPGDDVTIGSGDVVLLGSEAKDSGAFDDNDIALGTPSTAITILDLTAAFVGKSLFISIDGPAELRADGTTGFVGKVVADNAAASLVLTSQPSGTAAGALVFSEGAEFDVSGGAAIDLEGTITFETALETPADSPFTNNAQAEIISDIIKVQGSVAGSGRFALSIDSTLELDGAVAATETVAFVDVNALLRLASPASFAAAITGFSLGDQIDFSSIAATAAVYDATAQTLTLQDAGGAVLATLSRVAAVPGALVATPDGNGGTTVGYVSAQPAGRYDIAIADRAMGSDIVRATMTVPGTNTLIDGTGVKIGIISDSFDAVAPGSADQDAADGYLPMTAGGKSAVTVLLETTDPADATDEGRGMTELVHQIAPGAQLFFAAGDGGQQSLADAINALQTAGCNIIIDDVYYEDDADYQLAGPVDTAVTAALAAGTNFFTAADNQGSLYYEHGFDPTSTTLLDGTAANAQMFSNGTPYQSIVVPSGVTTDISLQWDAPFTGADGSGAADALTMSLFDASGALIATSTQSSDGNGINEADTILSIPENDADQTYRLSIYQTPGASPVTLLKYILYYGGDGHPYIADPDAGSGSGDIVGHGLVAGVNTVGAVYAGDTAAFGQSTSFAEYYSSVGPGTLLFDSAGNPLAAPVSVDDVDFLAPDGVINPVPDVAQFYGTSAAAPNAAGVAALMLQANPALTNTQVSDLLKQSAVSFGEPADLQGAGLIQAQQAVLLAEAAACYRQGTGILTPSGEVPIEQLAIGDMVITRPGAIRPIRWLGHRCVDVGRHPRPQDVMPVRIASNAFAEGQPSRDLVLSPDHAVYVGGALIPIRYLLNGASVVQEPARQVTWWHVELDSHDIILAQGLAAESYLDTGNRAAFANGNGTSQMHPAFARSVWAREACAHLVSGGDVVQRVRAGLLARLPGLGYALTDDPDLRVLAGDTCLPTRVDGDWISVAVPANTQTLRLISRSSRPAETHADSDDCRLLGVTVTELRLDGSSIPLDHASFASGWHPAEAGMRWTNGDASLRVAPGSLVEMRLPRFLKFTVAGKSAPDRDSCRLAA